MANKKERVADQDKVFEVFKLLLQHRGGDPVELVRQAIDVALYLGYSHGHVDPIAYEESVDSLDLTVRAMNCLNDANIKTIDQLCMHSAMDLIKLPSFGRKTLDEVRAQLAWHGRHLKDDPPPLVQPKREIKQLVVSE